MNQSYARVNAPYMLCSRARNMFGVQLYKNNAGAFFAYFEHRQFRLAAACAQYRG